MDWIDEILSELDKTAPAEYWVLDRIESYLKTATIPIKRKEEIYREMDRYTQEEAVIILDEIYNNQVCPIEAGNNYNQTYIIRKLNQL